MKSKIMKIALLLINILLLSGCYEHTTKVQGYMDADYTYISSPFSGILKSLFVERGNSVKLGQNLYDLDIQPQIAQEQASEARVIQNVAQVNKQQIEYDYQAKLFARYQKLLKASGISKEEFESVKNNYLNAAALLNSNKASLQAAKADLEEAKWKRASKISTSPVNGYIYDTYYTVGELVDANRPVLAIIAPENLKVVFYISEPLLKNIKLKQIVTLTCDGCKKGIPASISYISSKTEYTPPYIYSEKTRVKFVYRVEAKANTPNFSQLHPGQPVSVKIKF